MSDDMFVRLKPYNEKLGHLTQRYHYKRQLYFYDQSTQRPVWFKVTKALSAELEELLQNETDPMSPKLFDVLDPEDHAEVLKTEENLRMVELGITTAASVQSVGIKPVDLTKKAAGRAAAVPEASVVPVEEPTAEPVETAAEPAEAPSEEADPEPPAEEKPTPRRSRSRGRSRGKGS